MNLECKTELDDALVALAGLEPPVSESRIYAFNRIALKYKEYFRDIVNRILLFVQTTDDKHIVPGLYVIDSLCKLAAEEVVRRNYRLEFENGLLRILPDVLKKLSNKNREEFGKLLDYWRRKQLFSEMTLSTFESSQDPGWTTPAIVKRADETGQDSRHTQYQRTGSDFAVQDNSADRGEYSNSGPYSTQPAGNSWGNPPMDSRSIQQDRARSVTCYNCGEMGHFSRDCPNPRRDSGSRGESVTCYNCGERGHFSRDCPKPRREPDSRGGRDHRDSRRRSEDREYDERGRDRGFREFERRRRSRSRSRSRERSRSRSPARGQQMDPGDDFRHYSNDDSVDTSESKQTRLDNQDKEGNDDAPAWGDGGNNWGVEDGGSQEGGSKSQTDTDKWGENSGGAWHDPNNENQDESMNEGDGSGWGSASRVDELEGERFGEKERDISEIPFYRRNMVAWYREPELKRKGLEGIVSGHGPVWRRH